MARAIRFVDAVRFTVEAVAVALLTLLCVDVMLGVADRFLLHLGWPWPEELARFVLVWLTFLTAGIAARSRGHFTIDFFVDRLVRGRAAIPYRLAMNVAVGLLLLVVIVKGAVLTAIVADQTSPALGLPMSFVYSAIPAGALLMLFFIVADTVEKLLGRLTARR